MRIYEFSTFNNENILCSIKIKENIKWQNQFYLTECDRTHSYLHKSFNFDQSLSVPEFLVYQKLEGDTYFKKPGLGLSRRFPFIRHKHNRWVNESRQRNLQIKNKTFHDDDIIIISDLDEIINPIFADDLIKEVKKRGVITIRMYNTVHYFNLLSSCGGPKDWSYRVFILTGKYYNNMKKSIDNLRKAGERGQLCNEIYCYPHISGFHHSWLGNIDFLINKFKAYAHHPDEFNKKILTGSGRQFDTEYIQQCINSRTSLFNEGERLEIYEGDLLQSVEVLKENYSSLFA
jgi:hypothetical protein